MTWPPVLTALSSSEKDALIGALVARIDALAAENAALKAENAALRETLNRPPKTPDNSSTPPSQGPKQNREVKAKPKRRVHAGAHRPLHPDPTRQRDVFVVHCPHCRAAVTAVPQVALQGYGRIEIPAMTAGVTRGSLCGGRCRWCRGRFRGV